MQLVMLAAGRGTRFGGLKQIAAVGPNGEALMDFTARAAERAGFDSVVLVVRDAAREVVLEHVARAWPASLPVEPVLQPASAAGTVPAVLAASEVLDGPFAVVNADDLYDVTVLSELHAQLREPEPGAHRAHVIVCYQLVRTVLTGEPVKRGLCELHADGTLADVVEHHVRLRGDGAFDAWPLEAPAGAPVRRVLSGVEPVSMNLWGFQRRVLVDLAEAMARPAVGEVLLPDVLGALVRDRGEAVRVCHTPSRCVGLTHREDLVPLREQLPSFGLLDGLLP